MLGPVLGAELLRAGRRGRAHVGRWAFAGWLALQFLSFFGEYASLPPNLRPTAGSTAGFARGTLDLLLAQQFLLVFLATPAFAAGAVTDEKTRRTLDYLLASPLGPTAVVLGKLF